MIHLLCIFLLACPCLSFAVETKPDTPSAIIVKGIVLLDSLDLLSASQLAEVNGIEALGFSLEDASCLKNILEPFYKKNFLLRKWQKR